MIRTISLAIILPLVIGIAGRECAVAEDGKEPSRISNGDKAPGLALAEWSDGANRRLEDLKGKTVVLHFWGTWCGPCIATIPVWKRLEDKYNEHGVVFLGIHTAGAKMEAVRKFMKSHDWQHLTAVDQGKSIPDSITFRRYGVPAVNQIVVIDPDGVVRYNGDLPTQTDGPVSIAKKLGVKGPGDDATEEEMREGGIAILTYMYGKEIEAALNPTNHNRPKWDAE
jgi:thiol-disulfide isomerase/thioredoxin